MVGDPEAELAALLDGKPAFDIRPWHFEYAVSLRSAPSDSAQLTVLRSTPSSSSSGSVSGPCETRRFTDH